MDVPDCPALPIYSSFPTCWVGLTFGLQSCCQRDLWLICFRKLRFCSASLYWLACRSRTRENCSIAWHRKKLRSVVNIYPVSPVSIGPKVGILNWRAILHETKCCRIDRVMSCPDHRVEHAVWSRGSDSEIILQQRYCQLMSIVNFREICVRTRPVNPKPLGWLFLLSFASKRFCSREQTSSHTKTTGHKAFI